MTLEATLREDTPSAKASRKQRAELIEKVLAVELGVTDGTTVSLVEAGLPENIIGDRAPDREVTILADFLRKHLARHLAEQ